MLTEGSQGQLLERSPNSWLQEHNLFKRSRIDVVQMQKMIDFFTRFDTLPFLKHTLVRQTLGQYSALD